MRIILSIVLVLVCSVTQAQNVKDQAEYNKSVTALMGGISQLKAAEVNTLKGIGEHLHKLATIQELQEKIRTIRLDNDLKYAQNFYAKRKLHEENCPARKTDVKKLDSLSEQNRPTRLTTYAVNKIEWPTIFEQDRFFNTKVKIQNLLNNRTVDNSGLGSDNYNEISRNIDAMKTSLKDYIDTLKPMEYLVAKRFLNDLDYSGRFKYNPLNDLVASK